MIYCLIRGGGTLCARVRLLSLFINFLAVCVFVTRVCRDKSVNRSRGRSRRDLSSLSLAKPSLNCGDRLALPAVVDDDFYRNSVESAEMKIGDSGKAKEKRKGRGNKMRNNKRKPRYFYFEKIIK